jgi:predicted DNA-binding protein
MKRTSIFLPQPLLERLRALSTTRDVSIGELVRQAVEAFLVKHGG